MSLQQAGFQYLDLSQELWSFELHEQSLMVVVMLKNKSATAVYLHCQRPFLEKMLQFIQQHKSETEQLKVIATDSCKQTWEKFWTERGEHDLNLKLNFRSPGTQVRFWPKDGKIQASVSPPVSLPTMNLPKSKKKVLIIDDSKTIRVLLQNLFSQDPQLEIVGSIELPSQAEAMIKKFQPDVITLDIHMPEMNGVELLKTVIKKYAIPTVMITSLSMAEGSLVMEALANGAIDYIQKPTLAELDEVGPKIVEKVVAAASVNLKALTQKWTVSTKHSQDHSSFTDVNKGVILIGSSTGGTQALQHIFEKLPAQIPPILVVQHIPAIFSKALADRLNSILPFTVKEAEDQEVVTSNKVLIAPGGKHMGVKLVGRELRVYISDEEPVNRFRPSVDYLFDSYVKIMDRPTVAVILTGMGKDGANGILRLKNKGALTIAQDEESSVVFGMPKEAIRLGGASVVSSLGEIHHSMLDLYSKVNMKKVG